MKSLYLLSVAILFFVCCNAQNSIAHHNKIWNLTEVDSIPEFPGGTEALAIFMKENLVSPPDLGGGCGGDRYAKVVTTFTVDLDGSINHITIIDSAGPLYNQEAVIFIQSLPRFKPAYKNGEVVKCCFTLPVIFGSRKKHDSEY